MPSVREQVLAALLARLRTVPGPAVRRNEVQPEKVPAGGLVILRDGDPGDPDAVLSPLTWLWRHGVPVEVIVQRGEAGERDRLCDDLVTALAAAIETDRTLGGLADWLEVSPPAIDLIAIEGAAALKVATLTVTVHYATS